MPKKIFAFVSAIAITITLCSCSALDSMLNDIKGDLIGNNYTIYTYDNYGQETLKTTGKKINLAGNRVKIPTVTDHGYGYTYELSSVIIVSKFTSKYGPVSVACILSKSNQRRN